MGPAAAWLLWIAAAGSPAPSTPPAAQAQAAPDPTAADPSRSERELELRRLRALDQQVTSLLPDLAWSVEVRGVSVLLRGLTAGALVTVGVVAATLDGADSPLSLPPGAVALALVGEGAVELAVPAPGCLTGVQALVRTDAGSQQARVAAWETCLHAEADRAAGVRLGQALADLGAAGATAGAWAASERREWPLLAVAGGLSAIAAARLLASPEERLWDRWERVRGPPLRVELIAAPGSGGGAVLVLAAQ